MKKAAIERVILFQIEVTNKKVKQFSQAEFDRLDMGITVDQWVLLKIIEERGPLSQSDLAARSSRDPASITRTLDILMKKELIRRERIEGNRRQYDIVLSGRGEEFVKQYMPMIDSQRALSTKGFTKSELEQFSSFLRRVQDNMS